MPERWAFGQSGGYFTAEDNALEGVVHIYIDNSLLFITTFQHKYSRLGQVCDKVFVLLFGRIFIANCLFHEIGHHKFMTVNKTSGGVDGENYARDYAYRLLNKHIYLAHSFKVLDWVYRALYKKRIDHAMKCRSELAQKRPDLIPQT